MSGRNSLSPDINVVSLHAVRAYRDRVAGGVDFEIHLRHALADLTPEQRFRLEEWFAREIPGFKRFFELTSTFGVDR
jgi:maltooligosyltrehalose synthase